MIRKTSVLRIDKLILMISLGLVRDTPTLSKLRHLYDRNISLSFKSIYLAKKVFKQIGFSESKSERSRGTLGENG